MRRPQEPGAYAIRVHGHLASRWDLWFDGMTLTAQQDGSTLIHGPVTDQAALHGLLQTLGRLGLPLLSVTPDDADLHDEHPDDRYPGLHDG